MNPHHAIPQQLCPYLDLLEADGLDVAHDTAEQTDHRTVTDCPRLGVWADGR